MYVKCPAANIKSCDTERIWAKACDGLGGPDGGLEAVTSGVSACTDRGTLIGYVIGISMPDAEI